VPGKPASAERRIEDTLEALRRALTRDIDVAVRGDSISIEQLAAQLATEDIRPRIADALAFARENLVLLLRHAKTGVDLDVSLAWSNFEIDALRTAEPTRFGRARVPMSSVASLVVFKAIAGRPRDLEDVEALLVLHPDIDLVDVRARLTELAILAEAPEVIAVFDDVVRRVTPRENRATKKKSKTSARKRRGS
jgi:hypothetical protein